MDVPARSWNHPAMTTTAPRAPRPTLDGALGPFTDDRPCAAWGLRVLATLLDSALVATVVFVATGASPTLASLPGLGKPGGAGGAAWTAGTLLVLGVLQAYTGMTPGKRVAHVAVVDDRTGRPIGLPGTVLRWFAHVLDAILLIGYLRSAFRTDGRTFADSLLGTVAVRTTAPPPHPLVARLRRARDARAPWLRWPRQVTSGVALVLCAAAAAASVTSSSGGSFQTSEAETTCAGRGEMSATARIGTSRETQWDSRWGISHITRQHWQVGSAWTVGEEGDPGADPDAAAATARLTVRGPDGLSYFAEQATPGGPSEDVGEGSDLWWSEDGTVAEAVVDVPEDVSGWTVHAVLVDGRGSVLAECTAPAPGVDADPYPS
ncbi:hypothetical protein JCM11754A_31100 [Isoptericola variabilis]